MPMLGTYKFKVDMTLLLGEAKLQLLGAYCDLKLAPYELTHSC